MAGTFDKFKVFGSFRSGSTGPFTHVDPSSILVFSRELISENAHVFYENELGKFPFAGLHQILDDDDWLDEHKSKIKADVERGIPDPEFDGIAIIGYEGWHVLFDWEDYETDHGFFYDDDFDEDEACKDVNLFDIRDKDYKEDFYNWWYCNDKTGTQALLDESQATLDGFMKSSWNETAKEFYEVTIEECKKVRPKAKWSFLGYPRTIYQDFNLAPNGPGVFGYGRSNKIGKDLELQGNGQTLNDDLSWLYELMDVMTPRIYCPRYTVDLGALPNCDIKENSKFHDEEFLRSNCREFQRVSDNNNTDFMCVVWNMYEVERSAPYYLSPLNDTNWNHQIVIPFEEGAFGMVLWSSLFVKGQDEVMNEQFEFIDPIIRDTIRNVDNTHLKEFVSDNKFPSDSGIADTVPNKDNDIPFVKPPSTSVS